MALTKDHLYIVILCGGGGTRLWPLSRKTSPKQFIDLLGVETLFEKTLKRAQSLVDHNHIYVMTNKQYEDEVRRSAAGIPESNIIAEPEKKNTALAMGVIAGIIHTQDPEAVVINLASDHLINNPSEFNKTVMAAAEVASSGHNIVSVGIQPTFAHTGYGYIHSGELIEDHNGYPVYKVVGFAEKPSESVAEGYLATKEYYWNANLYTWSTALILKEFETLAPELFSTIKTVMSAVGTPSYDQIFQSEYKIAKEEQIDTAISEKTDKLVVIPGDFGWTDIGSWNVVHDEVEKDENGNGLISREEGSEWFRLNTKNSLVSTGKKQIVTIGLENVIIVDTPDAILVAHKDHAQDVKKVVEFFKESGKDNLL
jgi:mannose-1-phosphate guanylyltransferase